MDLTVHNNHPCWWDMSLVFVTGLLDSQLHDQLYSFLLFTVNLMDLMYLHVYILEKCNPWRHDSKKKQTNKTFDGYFTKKGDGAFSAALTPSVHGTHHAPWCVLVCGSWPCVGFLQHCAYVLCCKWRICCKLHPPWSKCPQYVTDMQCVRVWLLGFVSVRIMTWH